MNGLSDTNEISESSFIDANFAHRLHSPTTGDVVEALEDWYKNLFRRMPSRI